MHTPSLTHSPSFPLKSPVSPYLLFPPTLSHPSLVPIPSLSFPIPNPFLPFLSLPPRNNPYRICGSAIAPPAGPGGARPLDALWCNSQPKICRSVTVSPTCTRGPCNIFYGMQIRCMLHEYLHTRCSHKEIIIPVLI